MPGQARDVTAPPAVEDRNGPTTPPVLQAEQLKEMLYYTVPTATAHGDSTSPIGLIREHRCGDRMLAAWEWLFKVLCLDPR